MEINGISKNSYKDFYSEKENIRQSLTEGKLLSQFPLSNFPPKEYLKLSYRFSALVGSISLSNSAVSNISN